MGQQKKAAIDAYREYGTVSAACLAADIGRSTWYRWKKEDAEFAEAVAEAEEDVADSLEKEAIRRAKESSDTLLIFLLKGHKPEKYKDRVHQDISGELTVKNIPDDELESRLTQLLGKAGTDPAS